MIIQLEIPMVFERDYENDRFDDFFKKVNASINHFRVYHFSVFGNYETEITQMMADAFKESKPIC